MHTKPAHTYQTPYVLAIDIGSSAVKAAIYDATATALQHTQVSIPNQQRTDQHGAHEQDPELLRTIVEDAADKVLRLDTKASRHIAAVAVDSMASTILGIDKHQNPVTPIYTYADTRSAPDVARLRNSIDIQDAYDRTGVMQHTSYVPARILWLRRTQPDIFKRIETWIDAPSYIYSRWFDRKNIPASHSIASWSGLLNRRELDWDKQILEAIDLPYHALNPTAPYSNTIHGLANPYKKRWQQLANVPFLLPVGDGAAINIGAACTDNKHIALTVGTTAAMRLIAKDTLQREPPHVPQGLWGYRLGKDLTLLGGAFSEGGNVVQWAQQALNIPDLTLLDDRLKDSQPDQHRLTVLPFIAGERAVGWSNNASCTITGIRVSTTGLDIIQAMMEAVAYRFSLVADLLRPHMTPDHVFIAGGGGMTNSKWWLQTLTDVLQAEIQVPQHEQVTSRGAAILALHTIGAWRTIDQIKPKIAAKYHPNPIHKHTYQSAKTRQQTLYNQVITPN